MVVSDSGFHKNILKLCFAYYIWLEKICCYGVSYGVSFDIVYNDSAHENRKNVGKLNFVHKAQKKPSKLPKQKRVI